MMRKVAWDIWRELKVPSPPNEHPYHSLTIAAAHVLLGACAKALLATVMPAAFAVAAILLVYGWFKERRDMMLGGSRVDCAIDLTMVGFGALYVGRFLACLAQQRRLSS